LAKFGIYCGIAALSLLIPMRVAAWILPGYLNAVASGMVPRLAAAKVLRKECSAGQGHFGEASRCQVWYRFEDFFDIPPEARDAVLEQEWRRFAKEGARSLEVSKSEFQELAIGDWFPIKYAYYPGVLGEVSGDIRVPW
jgi:hypothetical protein